MKVKLDENMPLRLKGLLDTLGHQVDTIAGEGLAGATDSALWLAVQTEQRFLMTQDLDFSDVRRFKPGKHAGVLVVRLREPGAGSLLDHVGRALKEHPLEDWKGCFVVLTERKLRVKRPT